MLNSFYDKFIYTSVLKYENNNFKLVNLPFMIVPVELMVSILRKEDIETGKEIYYSVKNSTKDFLLKQFELDFGAQESESLNFIELFFSASGWGKITLLDLNEREKKAIISVENSPFAEALAGSVKFECDHFLRGVFAAVFSHYFKSEVECVESKCLALGEKTCEFVVKKAVEFNYDNPATRRQLRV